MVVLLPRLPIDFWLKYTYHIHARLARYAGYPNPPNKCRRLSYKIHANYVGCAWKPHSKTAASYASLPAPRSDMDNTMPRESFNSLFVMLFIKSLYSKYYLWPRRIKSVPYSTSTSRERGRGRDFNHSRVYPSAIFTDISTTSMACFY